MRNSHRYNRRVGFEQLEDRRLLANSPILVAAHLFYNNSSFDGSNPIPGVSDDAAIATNKSWLLPGQTATFANYSSYDKGINGLSIDMRNLGSLVTGPDLIFKAGYHRRSEHMGRRAGTHSRALAAWCRCRRFRSTHGRVARRRPQKHLAAGDDRSHRQRVLFRQRRWARPATAPANTFVSAADEIAVRTHAHAARRIGRHR